jgi:hypothetical protein
MSISGLSVALGRIQAAPVDSPIAIFRTSDKEQFDVVFGDSITTRQRIERDTGFVGMFDGSMDLSAVISAITNLE